MSPTPSPAERLPTDWKSDAMRKRIARRYAAERRFHLLGLGAVLLSAAFLAFLLVTMMGNGLRGFTRTEIALKVDFPASPLLLDPQAITNEALEIGVIDLIAQDVGDLLQQVHGRTVDVRGRDRVMDTSSLLVEQLEPNWKSELLGVITSPTIAYLLLLIGVYGLIFEGYNPGAVFPGVLGAICLLVALYAFQMLPVNYAGFALIILGIILLIGEAIAPSFGALGIGGVIAMVIGSIILIDTDVPGFMVSRPLIGGIALVSSFGLMAILNPATATDAGRSRQRWPAKCSWP